MTSPIALPPYRAVSAITGTDEELSDAAELVGRVVSFMLHNGLQVCGVTVLAVEREQHTGRPIVVYRVPTAKGDSKCPLDAMGFLYVGDYHAVSIGEKATPAPRTPPRVAVGDKLPTIDITGTPPDRSVIVATDQARLWRALNSLPYAGGLVPHRERITVDSLLALVDQLAERLAAHAKEVDEVTAERARLLRLVDGGRDLLQELLMPTGQVTRPETSP